MELGPLQTENRGTPPRSALGPPDATKDKTLVPGHFSDLILTYFFFFGGGGSLGDSGILAGIYRTICDFPTRKKSPFKATLKIPIFPVSRGENGRAH